MKEGWRLLFFMFLLSTTMPLMVMADKKSSASGDDSEAKKGIKELIYKFSDSYPEAIKYLKNEKNIDLNNPKIVEKLSLKDVEKAINDYKGYQLNTQRKLNSLQDKKDTVPSDGMNSTASVASVIVPGQGGGGGGVANQNTKGENEKPANQTVPGVAVTFDKNELLMGTVYGISCAKNTVHNVIINNKPWAFKLPERLSNNAYFKDSEAENSENLSCGRFSSELMGTFKVKCSSGVLSISGDCKPSICQEGMNVSLKQWDILPYTLTLDKNYSNNSYVKDLKSSYISFDNGDYLSCKRFDPTLEGYFKIKCQSGVLVEEEVGCSLVNNATKSCTLDPGAKKVVCTNKVGASQGQNVAASEVVEANVNQLPQKPKKPNNNESNVQCGSFYKSYDITLYTNVKPPYSVGAEVYIHNTEECEVTLVKCNSKGNWEVSTCSSMPSI